MGPVEKRQTLARFVDAQAPIYRQVVEELTAGHKRTHWIWFIFPQLLGLGHSFMSQIFAVRDLAEARDYLADPILGTRLRQNVQLMMTHGEKTARQILGTPDDLKFRSCLTLFYEAARDESDRSLFANALDQFYSAEPDSRTRELLRG